MVVVGGILMGGQTHVYMEVAVGQTHMLMLTHDMLLHTATAQGTREILFEAL